MIREAGGSSTTSTSTIVLILSSTKTRYFAKYRRKKMSMSEFLIADIVIKEWIKLSRKESPSLGTVRSLSTSPSEVTVNPGNLMT